MSTIFPGGMDTTFWEHDPRKLSGEWDTSRMLKGREVATAVVQIASLPPGLAID